MSDLNAIRTPFLAQLTALVGDTPPPKEIVAFYFGLFERADPKGVQLSILGTTQFDETDSDWACEDEDSWSPSGRYFNLKALESVPSSEWQQVQNHCHELLSSCKKEIEALLGTPQGRPIAIGWDDGDLEVVFVAKRV